MTKSNVVLFVCAIFLQLVAFISPGIPGLVFAQEKIILPNNPPFIQKPKPNKLVVFIHGINGDPTETWENEDQKFFWPRELAEDPDFKHVDVLSFGYESECGPSLNIREIATHLYTTLDAAVAKTPYQSLSFVAHSMGGLVVREFILTHLQKLQVPLDSMVLLSTPNLGSSLANLVNAFCQSDSLMDLKDGRSGYVDSLNDRWREQFEQPNSVKPFHFAAGYELVPMFLVGRIVEKESAIAFAQQISAFKKDHSTIAKLNGLKDPAYTWVKGRLLKTAPSRQEKVLSEAEEQRYTEIIRKLQEELRGTDLEQALKLIAEDRLDEALALLSEKEEAEEKEIEKIAQTRFAKAQVLELKLRYRDAFEYYEKTLQLVPTNTTYLNDLGLMHNFLGNYDKAIEYYEKALASDLKTFGPAHPKVASHWNNVGLAWDAKGHYNRAIEYYEKALASNLKTFGPAHPEVATFWGNLGGSWHAKGHYDRAIEYYEKALKVFKKLGLHHRVRVVAINLAFARKKFESQ